MREESFGGAEACTTCRAWLSGSSTGRSQKVARVAKLALPSNTNCSAFQSNAAAQDAARCLQKATALALERSNAIRHTAPLQRLGPISISGSKDAA